MIIDTSAVVAVFLKEPEAEWFLERLSQTESLSISTGTLLECGIVLSHRKQRNMQHALQHYLLNFGVDEVPFSPAHRQEAMRAWWRYGKGRHVAALNFGDCIAYATARFADRPLLCKGDDFAKTDLEIIRP